MHFDSLWIQDLNRNVPDNFISVSNLNIKNAMSSFKLVE